MSGNKIWSGCFKKSTASLMESFSRSIHFDSKLFDADIAVNRAWAQTLREIGVYTGDEAEQVGHTLEQLQKEFHAGHLLFSTEDEDIHSAVERWLTERLGDLGAKIHTGRSRNDQVATDLRIWLRDALIQLDTALLDLQRIVLQRARNDVLTVMPGQTHLRQAQPISFGHYLMALFFQLQRDRQRAAEGRRRMDKMPLGSGALAGAAFPIDRDALAKRLEFDAPSENSIDATSDRDFATESLAVCSQIMLHLSRVCEDFIIWSSESYRFLDIDEAYATGSSMMPQKKNPDSLELIRGKTARVIGHQVTLLTLMKGIPTAYVRDLQEDKEPVFDALEQTVDSVRLLTGIIEKLVVNSHRMKDSLNPALYATDLADYLVRKGQPFRQAHFIVGEIVADAERDGISLEKIPIETLKKYSPLFESDVLNVFDPFVSLERRNLFGGTGPESVQTQIAIGDKIIQKGTL